MRNEIDVEVLTGRKCPYCSQQSVYTDSVVIYGKSYGMVYYCKPCDAWVGVHKTDNVTALGRLANAELRASKKLAHYYFDQLWKKGHLSRQLAYKWLSKVLGTDPEYTHIGMFDAEQCNRVAELSKQKLNG